MYACTCYVSLTCDGACNVPVWCVVFAYHVAMYIRIPQTSLYVYRHKMIYVIIILLCTCIQFFCHHGCGQMSSIYHIHGNDKTIIIESINFNNYENILQNLIMIAKIKKSNHTLLCTPLLPKASIEFIVLLL